MAPLIWATWVAWAEWASNPDTYSTYTKIRAGGFPPAFFISIKYLASQQNFSKNTFMTSLITILSDILGQVFEAQDLPAGLGAIRVSDRPDLAQFQCNGAMAAAKIAKKNPREIAQNIADALQKNEIFSKIEIAGPGFINLDVTDDFIARQLGTASQEEKPVFGIDLNQETIVLDYGGPNIAKPMHIGHLRTAIIGDSLRRMCKFVGMKTLGDIHMGDWGTHLGLLIGDYIQNNLQEKVLNIDPENQEDVLWLFNDMGERYPKASAASKEDESLKENAREITLKLQQKEHPYYAMWEKIRAVSIQGMRKNYAALNVHFDLWKGEADVHDLIEPMAKDLKEKSYAIESDGALVIPVEKNDDKKEFPPLILYKRDGAVMYGTTDMATIIERVELYNPTRIVYCVDQRQNLHFEQLFRAAKKTKIVGENVELTFAGIGTMNGTDGRPFATRSGGVMRLEDLIENVQEKANQRLAEGNFASDFSEEEKNDIAMKIGIAALKFADLQNARQSDYIFDLDRMTSFEGKTGPYVLYQAVRIKSLLRKIEEDFSENPNFMVLDEDRALALLLLQFPDIVMLALQNYAPHHLCDYVYRVAQQFSSFYASCHILSENDEALKNSRLALCALALKQIECTLGLLGIEIPDRM